jgi:N-acetylglucosaminyl-diphospho-decaprenol L-rhamnosyltransferase
MNVVVGIVYQRRAGKVPKALTGLEVMTCVNAEDHGSSPWSGFGANHNRLIEEAAGADWYVALNPDAAASRHAISELVIRAEAGGYLIAAPLLQTPWGRSGKPQEELPGPRRWFREAVHGAHALALRNGAVKSSGMARSAWVSGACMALRIGSERLRFDERYFMYFEDVDLCMRASAMGANVGVCTSITVEHDSGWSKGDPLKWHRGVEFARSALRFAERHGDSPAAMRTAGLVRYGSRACLRGRAEPERVASRSISRGFLAPHVYSGLSDVARQHNRTRG